MPLIFRGVTGKRLQTMDAAHLFRIERMAGNVVVLHERGNRKFARAYHGAQYHVARVEWLAGGDFRVREVLVSFPVRGGRRAAR